MSTTRSRSRRAPAIEARAPGAGGAALILVAHGERGGAGDNGTVRAHAERLAQSAPFRHVGVGLLNGRPGLDDALAGAGSCEAVHVFPFLMSEGYFTDTVIPQRLRSGRSPRRCILHRPLGVSRALTPLIADQARRGGEELGVAAHDLSVLLAGHGAKSNRRAREAVELHADALRRTADVATVATAYLEEAPFLEDALRDLTAPTVVVGMFMSGGLHAGEDVPRAMRRAARVPAYYTGAIGAHWSVSDIVACEVERHAAAVDQGRIR